jgi:hypothetical protein
VFENRELKEMFAPKRDKSTGGWRTLHNEELLNFNAAKCNYNNKGNEDETRMACSMHDREEKLRMWTELIWWLSSSGRWRRVALVISQMMIIIIVTAVETSNLTLN